MKLFPEAPNFRQSPKQFFKSLAFYAAILFLLAFHAIRLSFRYLFRDRRAYK
jgi:hypothetical protein